MYKVFVSLLVNTAVFFFFCTPTELCNLFPSISWAMRIYLIPSQRLIFWRIWCWYPLYIVQTIWFVNIQMLALQSNLRKEGKEITNQQFWWWYMFAWEKSWSTWRKNKSSVVQFFFLLFIKTSISVPTLSKPLQAPYMWTIKRGMNLNVWELYAW